MTKEVDENERIRHDIAQALGKPTLPAFLSEQDLETAGIRSASSLQRDRAYGIGMKFTKLGHAIRYPTHIVIDYVASRVFSHTGAIAADSPKRLEAARQNLVKAQAQRHTSEAK